MKNLKKQFVVATVFAAAITVTSNAYATNGTKVPPQSLTIGDYLALIFTPSTK